MTGSFPGVIKIQRRWYIVRLMSVILGVTVQGVALHIQAADCSVKPFSLSCEYLVRPSGLDNANPRLSWQLAATHPNQRGQRQTSYHILVASSEELLKVDQGDLWDSGVMRSDQSVNVPYAGKPLQSGQQCFWKVKVSDEQGVPSGWSESTQWTMGLLNNSDWKAEWIGADSSMRTGSDRSQNGNPPDPWLRKTFDLPSKPVRAVAYVASVGYHELYVNGHKVGDAVLEPCATDNRVRARYVAYEIGKYLKPGRNVLGLWLGTSWSVFGPYQAQGKPCGPIVLAQADIEFQGGNKLQVITDNTWKTHPSPNTLLAVWGWPYGGEEYDAGCEVPDWCSVDLDDSSWKPVSVFHPDLIVSAEITEPDRLVKEIEPVEIKVVTNGVYRVDMGVNYAGWFKMEVSGNPGDHIEFQFSEREDNAMTHGLRSVYIIGPSGKGEFCNRFNYEVGRWVQISGLKQKPMLNHIKGWLIRSDYSRVGGFECNQPLLNRIYDTTLWTFENLSLGSYVVDCPQRERLGYGGDAHATIRTALDNYHLGAFYTTWAEDWRDVQQTDGDVPYTAPTYVGGGGPAWSGFCITLPWDLYRYYGDTRILDQNFPMMQRWLAFLETKSTNNMLVRWGRDWDFLGDWVWPDASGSNDKSTNELFFNNCYWIYSLQTAAKIAEELDKPQIANAYRQRAEEVRKSVQQAFFNPADDSYVNGDQAYLGIALLVDLPPEELRPAVWQRLEKQILVNDKGHIHAGITGGAMLMNLLLANGRSDLIYDMASKTNYPGWGDMLEQGATTFWEDWSYRWSRLHSSYLYIGSWFIEGLAGIRNPGESGFKHFVIDPWISPESGLTNVSAHYDSLYGRIAVHWTLHERLLNLHVEVPPNTSSMVQLTNVVPDSVEEEQQSLNQVVGVSLIKPGLNSTAFDLEPGDYDFEAKEISTHDLVSPALASLIVTTDNQQGALPFTPTWTPASDSLIAGLPPTAAEGNFNGEESGANVNTLTAGGSLTIGQVAADGGETCSSNYVTCGYAGGAGSNIVYMLPASANGYNITNITVYGGWKDNGRDQQAYTVWYATIANPTNFIALTSVNYLPPDPSGQASATRVTIADSAGGVLTSNVVALKFDYTTPTCENGYCGYCAITVQGTAASSPSPANIKQPTK